MKGVTLKASHTISRNKRELHLIGFCLFLIVSGFIFNSPKEIYIGLYKNYDFSKQFDYGLYEVDKYRSNFSKQRINYIAYCFFVESGKGGFNRSDYCRFVEYLC